MNESKGDTSHLSMLGLEQVSNNSHHTSLSGQSKPVICRLEIYDLFITNAQLITVILMFKCPITDIGQVS